MMEHLLIHNTPHIGGKADNIQKQIYDLNVILGEYLASFTNIGYLLQKNILLSKQEVYPNLLLTQLMACQGLPPFLVTKYSEFILFQLNHSRSSPYNYSTLDFLCEYLDASKAFTTLYLESTSTPICTSQLNPRITMSTFQHRRE